jgi:hypothetical protein
VLVYRAPCLPTRIVICKTEIEITTARTLRLKSSGLSINETYLPRICVLEHVFINRPEAILEVRIELGIIADLWWNRNFESF